VLGVGATRNARMAGSVRAIEHLSR
jgi:hypothetical protein